MGDRRRRPAGERARANSQFLNSGALKRHSQGEARYRVRRAREMIVIARLSVALPGVSDALLNPH